MYELPLFPLNTVLFPGMPLRLHVFEERYREMIQHVLQSNQTFGVVLIKNGEEANGPLPEPYLIGCTARIIKVEPLENGQFNLTAVGDERFRVLRMGLSIPYLTAFVESLPLDSHHSMEVVRGVRLLRRSLSRYLSLLARYANQEKEGGAALNLDMNLADMQLPEDPMMLIYLAASLLQVPASEKQPLLEANTADRLLEMVQRLYRRELAVLPTLLEVGEEQARLSAWVN